jgi:hypothetical protein
MSVHAGEILHLGSQTVIDRIQSAGLGDVRLPIETIREVGNREVVDKVPGEPDFTFTMESLDVFDRPHGLPHRTARHRLRLRDRSGRDRSGPHFIRLARLPVRQHRVALEEPGHGFGGRCRGRAPDPRLLRAQAALSLRRHRQRHSGSGAWRRRVLLRRVRAVRAAGDRRRLDRGLRLLQSGDPLPTRWLQRDDLPVGLRRHRQRDSSRPRAWTTRSPAERQVPAARRRRSPSSPHRPTRRTSGSATSVRPPGTFPQTVHASTVVKPGAVRGRNIRILVNGSRLGGVQSAELEATVEGEVERELGTEDIVGFSVTGTDATGSFTVRAKDRDAFFDLLQAVTGVARTEVYGWFNDNTVDLQIQIENPRDTGSDHQDDPRRSGQVPAARHPGAGEHSDRLRGQLRVGGRTLHRVQGHALTGTPSHSRSRDRRIGLGAPVEQASSNRPRQT